MSFETSISYTMLFFLFMIIFSGVIHMAAEHQPPIDINVSIEDYLHSIRDKILSTNFHFHYDWGTNGDFSSRLYANFTSSSPQIPVMIVINELALGQTGNILGNFLQYIACGQMAGAHLVIVDYNRQYDFHDLDSLTDPLEIEIYKKKRRYGESFFETIPAVIVNPHPAPNQSEAIANYEKRCDTQNRGGGFGFPWEHKLPIAEMIPYFRALIRPAIDAEIAFLVDAYNITSTMILPSEVEFEKEKEARADRDYRKYQERHKIIDTPRLKNVLNITTQQTIPFYPDVVIHWRCSDNIFFDTMGLTPYRFILNRLPNDAKYVFIATETKFYDINHPEDEPPEREKMRNHELCVPIITELVRCIRQRLPEAYVVVRSGGNGDTLFLTAAMLVHSKVTFCSESTFCFHFATAKPAGKLYLPVDNGIFYGTNLNCCGDDGIIETMADARPIADWRYPDADNTPMKEGDANATEMIAILHNESYPFLRSHRRRLATKLAKAIY